MAPALGQAETMSVYLVQMYMVERDKKSKYRTLMKKIHVNLRKHADDLPELISYRTYEAGVEGPMVRFVEVFEFTDQDGRERFFRRFAEARWLRALGEHFGDVVERARVQNLAWTEFLRDDWFVR
jgi:hypothetical protein